MLALTRRAATPIMIARMICVTVVAVRGSIIRREVTTPPCVGVNCAEVHERPPAVEPRAFSVPAHK
jgi:sRNA-binding carbon storage regulator CsrA